MNDIKNTIKLMKNEQNCIVKNKNGCDRKCNECDLVKTDTELLLAFNMAIQALEKQIPKKPIEDREQNIRYTSAYSCPTCGGGFTGTGIADYCYHCGQKLDWPEAENERD